MARKKPRKRKHSPPEKPHSEPVEEKPVHDEHSHDKPSPPHPADDAAHTRISVLIYVLGAIGMGFLSLQLSPILGNILTVFLALVVAFAIGKLVQAVLGKKDAKWLIGNGMFIYLFVWLISWILFFNLLSM
jgi:hypothetical protein